MTEEHIHSLRAQISRLESELQTAKVQLSSGSQNDHDPYETHNGGLDTSKSQSLSFSLSPSTHSLLLLSDSALPLGSFAYSSGLESFIAHHKPLRPGTTLVSLFPKFLRLSIQSIAHTNVPYLLACFRNPKTLHQLDNDLDASTACTVARRASVAQGRALLGVWEKSFATSFSLSSSHDYLERAAVIAKFMRDLKTPTLNSEQFGPNGHFAPLWGVICSTFGLDLQQSAYLFLFNHAKAVLSAAVRASVMGPYQAQSILAAQDLQELIRCSLEAVWHVQPEDAGQVVPSMDLWVGRHELLYSRIFNS